MSLSLEATAIGSFPHKNPDDALGLIFDTFSNFPVFPQLAKVSYKEDMAFQYSKNIPGLKIDTENRVLLFDNESDEFYEQLEEFFMDYEAIIEGDLDLLEKYAIKDEFASASKDFFNKLNNPQAVKVQVTGPFSWGTTIKDEAGKCAFFDETMRDILVKALTLKALWQVKKVKENTPNATPVLFLDEPTMSQFGTSAFLTVSKEDIITSINEIADILKEHGAKVGIHCCGKTDWSLVLECNIDIVNFDAFFFAQSLSLYANEVQSFIEKNGIVAWGIIPTLDTIALEEATVETLEQKFEEAKTYLIEKNVNEKLLLKQSIITPSCGAGSLNEEQAKKAMKLTKELSENLKEKYLKG